MYHSCTMYHTRYLPDDYEDLKDNICYAIKIDQHNPLIVEGVVFTTKLSIDWLKQLLKEDMKFALHCDGTRRLHHAKWMLITLGVTSMEWNDTKHKCVLSFRPLIYLFCKQQETVPAVELTVLGLRVISEMYFDGKAINPTHFVADHAEAMANIATNTWKSLQKEYTFFLQCYSHIRIAMTKLQCNLNTGKKKEARIARYLIMVREIYQFSGSVDMFMTMCHAMFDVVKMEWREPRSANWFWRVYVSGVWNNWALCMVEFGGV